MFKGQWLVNFLRETNEEKEREKERERVSERVNKKKKGGGGYLPYGLLSRIQASKSRNIAEFSVKHCITLA